MLLPPLLFDDVSLLVAVGSIVVLITAELSSPYYGQTTLTINRQKLKNTGYFLAVVFVIFMIIRLTTIVTS